jgi:hypothetical protein
VGAAGARPSGAAGTCRRHYREAPYSQARATRKEACFRAKTAIGSSAQQEKAGQALHATASAQRTWQVTRPAWSIDAYDLPHPARVLGPDVEHDQGRRVAPEVAPSAPERRLDRGRGASAKGGQGDRRGSVRVYWQDFYLFGQGVCLPFGTPPQPASLVLHLLLWPAHAESVCAHVARRSAPPLHGLFQPRTKGVRRWPAGAVGVLLRPLPLLVRRARHRLRRVSPAGLHHHRWRPIYFRRRGSRQPHACVALALAHDCGLSGARDGPSPGRAVLHLDQVQALSKLGSPRTHVSELRAILAAEPNVGRGGQCVFHGLRRPDENAPGRVAAWV